MPEKLLSDRQCAGAKTVAGEALLADGNNLYLRVRGDGSKDWLLIYRFGASRKKLGLGSYPLVSLAVARQRADDARALLHKGIDPKAQRDGAKAVAAAPAPAPEQAQPQTVGELFDEWLAKAACNRKDGGLEARRSFLKDVIPEIGKTPLATIRRANITALLDKVAERGVTRTCGVLLADMRQMFEFGVDREYLLSDPTRGLKKTAWKGIGLERDRVLSEAEITQLATKLPSPTAKIRESTQAATWIMLATLCRVGEIGRATWEHVDFEASTWTIPPDNSKNGKAHTIDLSPFALKQFRRLAALRDKLAAEDPRKRSLYVLPSVVLHSV